jgi:hypothetical protein
MAGGVKSMSKDKKKSKKCRLTNADKEMLAQLFVGQELNDLARQVLNGDVKVLSTFETEEVTGKPGKTTVGEKSFTVRYVLNNKRR